MGKLLVAGYCSIDHIVKLDNDPVIGHTSLILNKDSSKPYYGGCSINIASILSKVGLPATPIVRVGDDFKSSGFEQFLLDNHVDMSLTKIIPNEVTSHSYLLETSSGNHVTLFHPGAMHSKNFTPYDETNFKDARLLVLTINAYQDNVHLLNLARKYQIPLALGMKLDKDGLPDDLLKEIISEIKILFANENEIDYILKVCNYTSPQELFNDNLEIIVMTKGSEGSLVMTQNLNIHIPVYKDINLVDTAGAGDAYIAGFLYGYLNDLDLTTSGFMGSVMSSFILEAVGCTTNIPTKNEFIQRLNKFRRS